MNWSVEQLPTDKPNTQRLAIRQSGNLLSFEQVFDMWPGDVGFRTFYIDLLASCPFTALFWETPAVTVATVDRPYEFILADSPALARVTADPSAFAGHFRTATEVLKGEDETVIAIENLGGDAMLVVPCPVGDESAYPHLATFVREAPNSQQHTFFQRLGVEVTQRLDQRPLWINTSGLGVYWLHARLDSVPKYYTYGPYKQSS